jgi:cell surface protein SprA
MKFYAIPARDRRKMISFGLMLLGFLVGFSQHISAQSDTNSLRYKINKQNSPGSKIDLENPIKTEWRYNARENRYEGFRNLGSLSYPTGESMSVTEYFQKQAKTDQETYFRNKSQSAYALGSNKGVSDLIKAELNNPTVSKIFGEGGVDFQLNGSAMVKLGGSINVNRNPNFSKRQQRYFVPVFDQQMQISANGSVGEFVKLGINYDTEAAFEFDNQTNLGWKGKPDGILKDVQVGNVNLNLPTQLIKPANSLFGFSNTMQFGKTTIKTVFSQNKGQSTETVLKGGAQMNEFKITADNYDQNKHFFLSQFFRENYNKSLENLPIVASGVIINRVEVWVTNKNANVETPRDILAFQDLGEANPYRSALGNSPLPQSSNDANSLYAKITADPDVRMTGKAIDRVFANMPYFEQTVDFDMLNYARQLTDKEFSLNSQLGYISLNQPLNNDEILAVAFEYTYNGEVFQVGEFSRDVAPGNQQLLFLKMLKGNTIRTRLPIWKLMMKNIYALNTYSLSLEDFKLNLIYADDTTGGDYNYLPIGNANCPSLVNGNPLIRVMGLDKLNRQQEAKPDGVFDAIEGLTVNTQYARIIFPVTEPFGDFLREQFNGRNDLGDYYCYDALYDSTKWLAQQDVKHNKFFLQGSYKSSNGAELFLGTTNLQRGSVRVTANGRPLSEGMDYEVDYALGRVKIINEGLLRGGAEIRASADGQSFFNIQQKTLLGGRVEHKFNKKLIVGGTALHMYERPLTTKTNFNEEPLLNTILGADVAYSSKSRFLTKIIDALPFLETKEISNITAYGEFAKIFPHNHKSQGDQRGVSNLEDFENAELTNDLKNISNWVTASIPQKQEDKFPDTKNADKLSWMNHHAAMSFYTIDQLFYRDNDMPDNIKQRVDNILSDPFQRQVDQRELFPQRNFPQGTPTILPTLDMYFRPAVRGMYNYNSDPSQINDKGQLLNPELSWGGITRKIDQNDFEAANIDYIEIWMLDPMSDNTNLKGELLLHLGNVSEDILPDRRKSFENGLPTSNSSTTETDTTNFAVVPSGPQINFAFDNNSATLKSQDLGLDGMDDAQEIAHFDSSLLKKILANFGAGSKYYQDATADPSNDNYTHYLETTYDALDADIVGRYTRIQGLQGNSNNEQYTGKYSGMPKSSTPIPSDEDVNRDFTLNQSEDYYQYRIKISAADMQIGRNYITDVVDNRVKLRNGKERNIKWYQLKIPIKEFEKAVGNISDFKSIRFMRMVMTGFNDTAILRMGYINMVRADWRRYTNSLKTPGVIVPQDPNDGTKFVVSTVNIEENSKRSPIAYVSPPGIDRVQNMASLGTVLENEQSLSLQVCELKAGDSRAAFKTTTFDARNYKRMQLFIHAEESQGTTINDGEVAAFIRFGTDLTSNYYEYEIPLTMTRGTVNMNANNADQLIWPAANLMDFALDSFYDLKIQRQNAAWPMTAPFIRFTGKGKITVMGLPDAGNLRVMMVGIKNNSNSPKCFETWFNELRVKEIANKGGYATLANIQMQLADFGQLNMGGTIRTIGFGDVDKKLNDRSLSTNLNYDIASNLELGKFFPKKAGVSIPMYMGYSESYVRPKYYPLNPDLELKAFLSGIADISTRNAVKKAAEEYNSLYSINFNNVRVASAMGKTPKIWSPSNFVLGYSYQNNYRRNQQIEEYFIKTSQATIGYTYNKNTKYVKPFRKIKSKKLTLLRDFNYNLMPSSFSTQMQANRLYSEQQSRNNNKFIQVNPRLFDKNFTLLRNFNTNLPLTESIKINYSANITSRIQEPYGRLDNEFKLDSVRKEFLSLGRMTKFYQNVNATYTLPFTKSKYTRWINTTVTYVGSYEWNQAPPAFESLGNRLQNGQDINVSGQFNFTQLYSQIPWLRDLEKPKKSKKPAAATPKPAADDESPTFESALQKGKPETKKANPTKIFVGNFVSMLKNAGFSYQLKENTELPGFAYKPDYFGNNFKHMQPGMGFVFGLQDPNLRYKLADLGALKTDSRQSNFFRNNKTENFTANITIEPIKNFRIRLDFARNHTQGTQAIFKYDGFAWMDQGLTQTGNFNVTGMFFNTHFVKDVTINNSDNHTNAVFTQLLGNRYTVAQRLSLNRLGSYQTDTITKFPMGYSKNSQDVLVGAFYGTYAGQDVGYSDISGFPAIPLPNWNVNYNGLTKIKFLGNKFSNINIKHAYTGRYSIGNYTQNLRYDQNESVLMGKDLTPKFQIADATISEGFFPLIGVNLTTKNNWTVGMEYKRSRVLKLFAASFNLTEMRNNEFQLNAGYRTTGLTLPWRKNGRWVYLPNDFRFDMTVSVTDNVTVIRKVDLNVNKYTAGMKNIRISPSITYQVNQKINLAVKYNRVVMDPKVATQFYTALTDFGIEARYTFN